MLERWMGGLLDDWMAKWMDMMKVQSMVYRMEHAMVLQRVPLWVF